MTPATSFDDAARKRASSGAKSSLPSSKSHAMDVALDPESIHLTRDNLAKLQEEVQAVRDALTEKHPDEAFDHILHYLDPSTIVPRKTLVEDVLNPPEEDIYGEYGVTIKTYSLPYGIWLTKWIGIQVDVETPFLEELMLMIHRIDYDDQVVTYRNSHWRYDRFQKRRQMLQQNLKKCLRREILELVDYARNVTSDKIRRHRGLIQAYLEQNHRLLKQI